MHLEQAGQRLERRVDRGQLRGLELLQARRQPGRALGADPAEERFALVGERERVAAAVARDRVAADESSGREPVDMTGHARCRHALLRRELGGRDAGLAFDRGEERGLDAAHAEGCDLAPQLPGKLEQHRPEAARNLNFVDRQHC